MDMLDNARRYLWAFVEIGFAGILAIMLIYLILGQGSGVFVLAVADNVMKFAAAVPTPSLIGVGDALGDHIPDHAAHERRPAAFRQTARAGCASAAQISATPSVGPRRPFP